MSTQEEQPQEDEYKIQANNFKEEGNVAFQVSLQLLYILREST